MNTLIAFTLLLITDSSANCGLTSSVCNICASGSLREAIDGTFTYLHWDSTRNGSIFYNAETKKYLYPYIDTSYKYIISPTLNDSSADAYSNIAIQPSGYIANMDDFLQNWKYMTTDGIFEADPNMRLVNCDHVCVSGSVNSYLNNAYKWSFFNRTLNASVYVCHECNYGEGAYVFPWIFGHTEYSWQIGSDPNASHAWHWCDLPSSVWSESDYLWNLQDCAEWHKYNGSNWISDAEVSIIQCTIPTASATDVPSTGLNNPFVITGLVLGIGVLLVVIIVVGLVCYKRRKNRQRNVEMTYMREVMDEEADKNETGQFEYNTVKRGVAEEDDDLSPRRTGKNDYVDREEVMNVVNDKTQLR